LIDQKSELMLMKRATASV